MFEACESLQDLCRRVILRTVGSKRLLDELPVPRKLVSWIRRYEEPTIFDSNWAARDVLFSADLETVTFTGVGYSTTLICTPYGHGYTCGKHEWMFYFNKCRGQAAICVVPKKFKKGKQFRQIPANGECLGWAYNQVGLFTYEKPLWQVLNRYGTGFDSRDLVSIQLDMDKGHISFTRNGKKFGIASDTGLRGQEVFPGVCLCSRREKATFLTSKTYI